MKDIKSTEKNVLWLNGGDFYQVEKYVVFVKIELLNLMLNVHNLSVKFDYIAVGEIHAFLWTYIMCVIITCRGTFRHQQLC